jgi:hypothetical protein
MAKTVITHACGHQAEHNVYGPHKRRPYKAAALAWRDCPECEEKERQARISKENAAAATAARERGLPTLTGTPKQIAWAESIRVKMIADIDAMIAGAEISPEHEDIVNAAVRRIKQATNAAWWIDQRYKPVIMIVDEAVIKVTEDAR